MATDFASAASEISARQSSIDSQSQSYLNQLNTLLSTDYVVQYKDFSNFSSGWTSNPMLTSAPSDISTGLYNKQTSVGDAPTDFDIREVNTEDIPDLATASPEINIPTVPVFTIATAPTAPVTQDVAVPDAPLISLPDEPTFSPVVFPSAPSLALPTFTEQFPEYEEILLNETDFSYVEADYSTPLLIEITDKIYNDVVNGGYGIETWDEEALWDRARDRENQLMIKNEETILDEFAARGFELPTGTAAQLLNEAKQDTMDKVSTMNREISIERAELFRKAREFALNLGQTVEGMLIQAWGFKQERLLKASQFAAEFGRQLVDYKIKIYNTKIEAYSAFASAYEAKIRATLAQVDIFRTQVEAEKAKLEGNKIYVDLYQAQLQAVGTIVQLYNSEIDSAKLFLEMERNKVQNYSTRVQAYVSGIQAQSAHLDLYNSQISGEKAKVDIFKAQVNAYESQVRAIGVKAEIQSKNTASDIEVARLTLAGHSSDIETYKARVAEEVHRVSSLIDANKSNLSKFSTLVSGYNANNTAFNSYLDQLTRRAQIDAAVDTENTKIRLAELDGETKIRLQAATEGAGIYKAMAGSINSAMSALAIKEE